MRGRSVATRLVSCAPLKLVPTASLGNECRIFTSSYGGGVLQGDQVELEVHCRQDSSLVLLAQGNQHLYACNETHRWAQQSILGTCASGAKVAIIPEPTVMHRDSRFQQRQVWDISSGSELMLLDGLHGGRSENGECFTYESFKSSVEFCVDGQTVYLDQFSSIPSCEEARVASRFGPYCLMFNLYSYGKRSGMVQMELAQRWDSREAHKIYELSERAMDTKSNFFCATLYDEESKINTTRILAKRRQDVELWMSELKLKVNGWMGVEDLG